MFSLESGVQFEQFLLCCLWLEFDKADETKISSSLGAGLDIWTLGR